VTDAQVALPVLVLRDARRAVAATPDRPEGYLLLANAYRFPLAPVGDETERQLQILTALARALERYPPPARCPPERALAAFEEGRNLAQMYAQSKQLDLAHAALKRALEYADKFPVERLAGYAPPQQRAKSEADAGKAVLGQLRKDEDDLYLRVDAQSARVDRASGAMAKFDLARSQGLPLKAVEVYKAAGETEFEKDGLAVNIAVVQIELAAGHLEQASTYLDQLAAQLQTERGKAPADVIQAGEDAVKQLKGMAARLAGNYPAAAAARDAVRLPTLPPDEVERAVTQPPVLFLLGGLVGGADLAPKIGQMLGIQELLRREADYYSDRAMLALAEGNIPEAERRLKQAARPQGIELGRVDPERAAKVAGYLRLIESARK
jgi:tetratricopeptide (TPR) repeat protein